MRAGLREDVTALADALRHLMLERRFNPTQPRDGDGRWTDGAAVDLPGFTRTLALAGGARATIDHHNGRPRLTIDGRSVVLSRDERERLRSLIVNAQYGDEDARSDGGVYRLTRQTRAGSEILVSLRHIPGTYITDDGRPVNTDEADGHEVYNAEFDMVLNEAADTEFGAEPSARVTLDDLETIDAALTTEPTARRVETGFGHVDVFTPGPGRLGLRVPTDDGTADVEFGEADWSRVWAAINDSLDSREPRTVDTALGPIEIQTDNPGDLVMGPEAMLFISSPDWSIAAQGDGIKELYVALLDNGQAAGVVRSAPGRMGQILRRFNPTQPRDGDGRWTDGGIGATQRFRAGRGQFGDSDVHAHAALVDGPGGREVRLGLVYDVGTDDGPWDADAAREDTVSLNRRALRRLRNDLAEALPAAQAEMRRINAAYDRGEDPDTSWTSGGQTSGVTWSMSVADDDVPLTELQVDTGGDWLKLDPKQLKRFLKYLDDLDEQLGGSVEVARYDPSQPRVEAGSSAGGQFAAADSGGRKKSNGSETLGYDPKTNRGTGYGIAGGDARVKQLQEALNRLGLTDQAGKPLKVDGKLGPKTTAAIKKLQKQLGVKADGQVTPAFLKQVVAMKSASPAAKTTPRPSAPKPSTRPGNKPAAKKSAPAGPRGAGKMQLRGGLDVLTTYDRTFPLDDIQIQRSGDGRTVEAYAAMFDVPYEVHDQHGHYNEVIDRAAFNRTLSGGAGRNAMCLYNHGMSVVDGKPDSLAQVPLGTPLEIKPDGRGLLTVTRYNRSALADAVLESIRNGDVRAQSFRGRIVRSSPNGRVPRARYGQALPTVTRHELGLSDYGPTPIPVNQTAEIVAVRSVQDIIAELEELDFDEREELLRSLNLDLSTHDSDLHGDPDDEDDDEDLDGDLDDTATSAQSEPGAEDPPAVARHSGRLELKRALLVRALAVRGVSRG